jgi:hypothetical protein
MRIERATLLTAIVLVAASCSGAGAGPWRADEDNTRGWDLMSPQERIAHQARVRGFTDYQSCSAYRAQHHQDMAERARQRGLRFGGGRRDFCDHLKPQPRAE